MDYTIRQAAEKLEVTTHTLRYYEREGLLPSIERDKHGNRKFGEPDMERALLIRCLRDTEMSVGEIKRYVDLCAAGETTVKTRRQMLLDHKQAVEQRIRQMHHCLERLDRKLEYYDHFATGGAGPCCSCFSAGSGAAAPPLRTSPK